MGYVYTKSEIAAVFNEWARLYSEDPGLFESILGPDGKPHKDYGEISTNTFVMIYEKLFLEKL